MAKKTVGIVGAGVSGLIACKHALHMGLHPVVFEAESGIGGVWYRTIRTTKLQTPRSAYQFIDFPWPEEVKEEFPDGKKVFEYIESYAQHFDLLRHIRFHSRVVAVDYAGVSEEEMDSWALWSGTGEAFGVGGKGRWQLSVQHFSGGRPNSESPNLETYEMDFLILCIGRFSGFPNIPSFPPNKSPQVFHGKVLHSMDYSNMDHAEAIDLLKGKRTVVVGYSKSAVDIAAECSDANGTNNPCTMLHRETRWTVPHFRIWGIPLQILYFTRLAELSMHKPGESPLLSILAALLSPLRWLVTKLGESYFKWKTPIKKHGLVPKHSFIEELDSCSLVTSPERFYERIEEGSIIPKRSQSFSFCEKGIITDEGEVIPADIVILATGFDGGEKIKNIFASPKLQKIVIGSESSISIPLYRDLIHPRIPQLAIIGYCETVSNIYTSQIRSIWLTHFLDGKFQLPTIRSMEEDALTWQEYMKRYCRSRASFAGLQRWYDEQLFKDIGFDPRQNLGLLG